MPLVGKGKKLEAFLAAAEADAPGPAPSARGDEPEEAPKVPAKKTGSGAAPKKGKASKFDAFMNAMDAEPAPKAAAKKVEPEVGIDIAFCFDTTGSMYAYLDEVRKKLKEVVETLFKDLTDLRIAVIAFGDYCDQVSSYVTSSLNFTNDKKAILKFLDTVSRTGGGDAPECYELVLRDGKNLDWGTGKRTKAFVIIGDDVPHPPSYTDQSINWRDEVQALKDMGVKIYSVQCNQNQSAAPFYEEMAELSGGFLIHMTNMDWMVFMFVGLCYRQHSLTRFESYRMDLIWNNKMKHDDPINILFMEMSSPVVNKQDPDYTGHLNQPWWDPAYDKGRPMYLWNKKANVWEPASGGGGFGGFGGGGFGMGLGGGGFGFGAAPPLPIAARKKPVIRGKRKAEEDAEEAPPSKKPRKAARDEEEEEEEEEEERPAPKKKPAAKKKAGGGGAVFAGAKFCITGTFSMTRAALSKKLQDLGATVATSVTRAVTHLLASEGESGTTKYTKAEELGIPIHDEDWIDRCIEEGEMLDE